MACLAKKYNLDIIEYIIKAYIDNNINIDAENWSKNNALELSLLIKRFDVAQLLINYGANVNKTTIKDKTSILLKAVHIFDNEAIKFLIKNGANINIQNMNGNTVLMSLIETFSKNYYDIIVILLEHGINIDIQNNCGDTALLISIKHKYQDIIELLLQNRTNIYLQNNKGNTSLILATKYQNLNTIKLLLQYPHIL